MLDSPSPGNGFSAPVATMPGGFSKLWKLGLIAWVRLQGSGLSDGAVFELAKQLRTFIELHELHLDMFWEKDQCDGDAVEAAVRDSIASLPRVDSSVIRLRNTIVVPTHA